MTNRAIKSIISEVVGRRSRIRRAEMQAILAAAHEAGVIDMCNPWVRHAGESPSDYAAAWARPIRDDGRVIS